MPKPTTQPNSGVWVGIAAGLTTAVLFTLAWPPWGLWPLVFVALTPLAWWVRRGASLRSVMLVTFCTQYPAWAALEWWIADLTTSGYLLLAGYMTLYPVLFAVLLRRLAASERFGRWPAAFVVPIAYGATEFLRTAIVLGGYPWFQLGVPLAGSAGSDGILAQSAAILGSHWLTFVAGTVSGAIIDLVERRRASLAIAAAVAAFQLANAMYGWRVQATATTKPGPLVLAVQTNLSVSNKNAWSQKDQVRDVRGYLTQTMEGVDRAAAAGTPVDLVVWPETMVPGFGLEPETIRLCEDLNAYPGALYSQAMASLRKAAGAPLLVGASVRLGLRLEGTQWAWDRHYNSVYLVDGEPPYPRYDKLVLTPGGEELPLISRWDWLEKKLLAIGAPGMDFDLDAGTAPVIFRVPLRSGETVRIVTPICFEDTVGGLCRDLCYHDGEKVADLMVNTSNDGWFGGSQGTREQHVLHARLRTIELAVPMIRCANSGLSVLIDDRGRVTHWIGESAPGRGTMTGTLLAPVALSERTTTYARVGEAWSWTILVGVGVMTILARRRTEIAGR